MRVFSRPLGTTDADDVSAAIQAELDRGPGTVHIPAGHYRCGELRVPAGVTVIGDGSATVLQLHHGHTIFRQENATGWALRDLTLDGMADGPWEQRTDNGQSGIITRLCWGFDLAGLTLRRFNGAALQLTHTRLGADAAPFSNGGALDRITASDSYIGIRFDTRAEYINATRLDCHHNVTGCVIHAGNVKLTASNICTNTDGLLIEDKENGSHGALSNCLINHNHRAALIARNVAHGMTIDNCCFFYGSIEITQSAGVSITHSLINCDLRTHGPHANRIAGNYVIPDKYQFEFAAPTRVENNYTKAGPWELNCDGRD